ncbi:hypothetical protein SEPCBS119000_003671 [Sporothrix epigloea]|uniref:Uncharacterized protein n=1 Tax=Sporothrix epigloea TaxID=1892477 RepID=A0ABP0DMY0_9PEZI
MAFHQQPNVPPSKQQTNYSQPNRIGASSGPAYYGGVNHAYGFEPSSQQGYYYLNPPSYSDMVPTANVSPYVSGAPQAPALPYGQQSQVETSNPSSGNPRKMVAQEVNGMVYYVDVSQLPTMTPYTGYGQEQMSQARYMPGAGGMITPASAEGHYYEGQPGMAYY